MQNFDLQQHTIATLRSATHETFNRTTHATSEVVASMPRHIRVDDATIFFDAHFFGLKLLEEYGIRVNSSHEEISYARKKMPDFPWSMLSPTILLPSTIKDDKSIYQALLLGLEEQNNFTCEADSKRAATIEYVALNTPTNLPSGDGLASFTDQLSDKDSSGLLHFQLFSFAEQYSREFDVQTAAIIFSNMFFGSAAGHETLDTSFLMSKDGTPSSLVLKPDIAAGHLCLNRGHIITVQDDLPQLHRAAVLLDRLKRLGCVMSTRGIPLPLVLGVLNGSTYTLFLEMAASYRAHEAFWKVPPPYVFGLHYADSTWRLYAMGADLEPVEIAVIHVRNIIDWVYFLTVCRRLGNNIKDTLALLEVDETKVQATIEQYRAMKEASKKKERTHSDKVQPSHRNEDADLKHHRADQSKDRADYSPRTGLFNVTSDKSSHQYKVASYDAVPVKGNTTKLADTPILIERVNGLVFAVKVGQPRDISHELYCYDKLKDCLYVPRVLGSGMVNNRQAFFRLPYLAQLPMPKDTSLLRKICRQILLALRAVHKQGLVHCDIKDDNIMWDQATDTVQLIDFEFAIELKDGYTFGLDYGGTPLFMSPELLDYKENPTHSTATNKSDVFSAGLVLAGLMYGVRIRSAKQRQLVLRKLRNRKVSAVGDELAVSLLLAMTSAEDRRPSAADCLKHSFLTGKIIKRTPDTKTPRLNDVVPNDTQARDMGKSAKLLSKPFNSVSKGTFTASKRTPLHNITNSPQ